MEERLRGFVSGFWFCTVASLLCAAFTFFLAKRRRLWLRLLDAEESFWMRFGIPTSKRLRTFAESRFFAISFAVFAVMLFLIAALNAISYFYFKR